MRKLVEIENIEQIRRQEGIEDVELQEEIRALAIGDLVRLTLLVGTRSLGTLAVRITSIRGTDFRGKLACKPVSPGPSKLRLGSAVAFTAAHIHSVARGRGTHGR
jgi:hypothetical protein